MLSESPGTFPCITRVTKTLCIFKRKNVTVSSQETLQSFFFSGLESMSMGQLFQNEQLLFVPEDGFVVVENRPYSYSQYWTGTSLQWRLMRGKILKSILI